MKHILYIVLIGIIFINCGGHEYAEIQFISISTIHNIIVLFVCIIGSLFVIRSIISNRKEINRRIRTIKLERDLLLLSIIIYIIINSINSII